MITSSLSLGSRHSFPGSTQGQVRVERSSFPTIPQILHLSFQGPLKAQQAIPCSTQTDPDYPRHLQVGKGTKLAQGKTKGRSRGSTSLHGLRYRTNGLGSNVAQKLHREMDPFRSYPPYPCRDRGLKVLHNASQGLPDPCGKLQGYECSDLFQSGIPRSLAALA